jgi:siroheme synthase-like protein
VSGYALVVEGTTINALIVGGGRVGTRKALSLLDAGARVRVVSASMSPALTARAAVDERLELVATRYASDAIAGATLVIAATDDSAVNVIVAADARTAGLLVNVADRPELGTFVTPAVHRAGDVLVAVSTGVPAATARVRDAIAESIDDKLGAAIGELAALRRELLGRGDRERWRAAAAALVGDDFVSVVETGGFAAKVAEWR